MAHVNVVSNNLKLRKFNKKYVLNFSFEVLISKNKWALNKVEDVVIAKGEGTLEFSENILNIFFVHSQRSLKVNLIEFCETINQLESLSSLTISDCKFFNVCHSSIVLKNLKHLGVVRSDWSILKIFEDCENIDSICLEGNRENFLLEFISNHPKIQVMTLRGLVEHSFKRSRNYPFMLTKLSVDKLFYWVIEKFFEEMLSFLEQQKFTLRELETKAAPNPSIMFFIMEELQLEKLQIGVEGFNDIHFKSIAYRMNQKYKNSGKPNNHLKVLELHGNFTAVGVITTIIKKYLSIETLRITHCEGKILEKIFDFIMENLTSLKHLSLPSLPLLDTSVKNRQLLKSLQISKIENSEEAIHLIFLVKHNPLETLKILHSTKNIITNATLSFLLENQNLKELCLGIGFEFDDEAFKIVLNQGNKLDKLIIFSNNVENTKIITNRTFFHNQIKLVQFDWSVYNTNDYCALNSMEKSETF